MTADTSQLEKLLGAKLIAEKEGFENTARSLQELVERERLQLAAKGASRANLPCP